MASHNYHDVYKAFPARQSGTGFAWDDGDRDGTNGQRGRIGANIALLPFSEGDAFVDKVGDRAPWDGAFNFSPSSFNCPSDGARQEPHDGNRTRGTYSYVYCGGDTPIDGYTDGKRRSQRGIFGTMNWVSMSQITDGTSNTIAISESVRPTGDNTFGRVAGIGGFASGANWSDVSDTTMPIDCRGAYSTSQRKYTTGSFNTGDTARGFRFGDGAAWFAGFCTILPPNSPSCAESPSHWQRGIFSASSNHPGGVTCGLADGSVRFVSETVDTNDLSAPYPSQNGGGASPYGVWGAMGTKSGGESRTLD